MRHRHHKSQRSWLHSHLYSLMCITCHPLGFAAGQYNRYHSIWLLGDLLGLLRGLHGGVELARQLVQALDALLVHALRLVRLGRVALRMEHVHTPSQHHEKPVRLVMQPN